MPVPLVPGENDLPSRRPRLAALWDEAANDDELSIVFAQSAKSYHWRCGDGHEFNGRPCAMSDEHPCGRCKRAAKSLKSLHPQVAAEWCQEHNGVLSEELAAQAGSKHCWRCPQGHHWRSTVKARTAQGVSCKICSGRALVSGVNDLATLHPELAALWAPENEVPASEVTTSGDKMRLWRCPERGHPSWRERVRVMLRKGGCPTCRGNVIVPGINDFAVRYPLLAGEWDREANGHGPEGVSPRGHGVFWWRCSQGHRWQDSTFGRTANGLDNPCPECFPRERSSTGERELRNFLGRSGFASVAHARDVIPPLELDIWLPELRKAIEFNGDHWHSTAVLRSGPTRTTARTYHGRKLKRCEAQGASLAFVWEHHWRTHGAEVREALLTWLQGSETPPAILTRLEGVRDHPCELC